MASNLVLSLFSKQAPRYILLLLGLFALGSASIGCRTTSPYSDIEELSKKAAIPEPIILREGDVIKINFPGAPDLNATPQIRMDGKINLSIVGEVTAAGMTPAELEKQLVKLYSGQLQNKEITVSLMSSSFPVFVTGAVLRPGKINSDRPITALEAIMEAGGFDYTKANLKDVRIIRNTKGKVENISLNLKSVLNGNESDPFYLKPSDIVYVKERFTWF